MSLLPHVPETLVHQRILFRDFLYCALASVVFAGHEERLDLREGEGKIATGFRQVEKGKGIVASGDVFEVETTGWYLKT